MSKPFGGVISLTATPVSIAEGIGATIEGEVYTVHSLMLRAGTANADVVYIGGSEVDGSDDTWMALDGGDALGFDLPAGDYVSLQNLFVVGTTNDILYVFAIQ